MAEDISNVQMVGGAPMQGGMDPSQLQQLQLNGMQQPQMMMMQSGMPSGSPGQMSPGVVQQGQHIQHLSPSGMVGGQLSPNQMGSGQIHPYQMVAGQLPPNQMTAGQLPQNQMVGGQLPPNQMTAGQLPQNQMVAGQLPPNQMTAGQLPQNQMVGGQLPPNQMTAGQLPQNQMVGGQLPPNQMTAGQLPQNQISGGQLAPNQMGGGQIATSPVQMGGGGIAVNPTAQMVGAPMAGGTTGQQTVGPEGVVNISMVGHVGPVSSVSTSETSVVESTVTVMPDVSGTINPTADQIDGGYTMGVVGVVGPNAQPSCTMEVTEIPLEQPGFSVDTIGMMDQDCILCTTKAGEIEYLEGKIKSLKVEFEQERDEIEERYMGQIREIEMRAQKDKDELRVESREDIEELEEKLKKESATLNDVQLNLKLVQAELDNAEKAEKRHDSEISELEDALRKVKSERDQFDEMNRRLKIELQKSQQQNNIDTNTINQLKAKLSQTSNGEMQLKVIREKEIIREYTEKMTVIQNTVTILEKQNSEYVNEIQILNEKWTKERNECDNLRAMLSEDTKDDEKQGKLIRDLQRKVKELNSSTGELEYNWRIDKQKLLELNSQLVYLETEKNKFEKLYNDCRHDIENVTRKYDKAKNEIERLEDDLTRVRREQNDPNNNVENIVISLEEKIRRLSANCDSSEDKYKYVKREKTDLEDRLHRSKSEISDLQEKYQRVDMEKESLANKCRAITDNYEQKIRTLQIQITELRSRPLHTVPHQSVQPIIQPTPVQLPQVVTYPSAPCFIDTMAELGISIEKYNEIKHHKDSIEQRYNALVDLIAKYEDEVQTLEKENKELRLSVTDVDFTSINITKQESHVSGSYTDVEYRRILDEKDYFEGRYKKEKADRENAEKKIRNLRHEKENLDDKLNEVANVITRYEQDLRMFRSENDNLRRQLQDLGSKFDSQKNISVELNVKGGRQDSGDKTLDKYNNEIDELRRENEEFKQLLDSLDSKDGGGKDDKDTDEKVPRRRMRDLENEVNNLQNVIMELERTIAYQNKTAEDGKTQNDEEKWKLKEHVQKLEDKIKDQVRMIDDYERKMVELRGNFTDEISNLGEKLLNEIDRNMKLEEHIKDLQKHLTDLDGERKEILARFDAASTKETEFVRDMADLGDRYNVDISELQNRLTNEMNEKSNLSKDIQNLLDELGNLKTRESAVETQFLRERDEIKNYYELEKLDLLRQYHEENTRIKMQLDEAMRKRKQLEDEIDKLKRKRSKSSDRSSIDSCKTGRGDVNNDDQRRRDYLEEENKKLLYQMNLLLSKKDGGTGSQDRDTYHTSSSTESSEDISRIRRKLTQAEEERDKFARMKKDLEYEMDRNKSKFDNLQSELEKYRDLERKNREITDELRSVKTLNDEMNRKQRDFIGENDKLNRTIQDMERNNRKLTMEIDHLAAQLKKLQSCSSEGSSVRRDETIVHHRGNNEEVVKMKYELESKLRDQLDANAQLEKNLRNLQREIEGMQDSRSLMQSNFNQQKEFLLQQVSGSIRGDSEANNGEWKRKIDECEMKFKAELSRIEGSKRDQYEAMKREKDAMADRFSQEKDEMRRKMFDIEEQLRRKESMWQSSNTAPIQQPTYPGQGGQRNNEVYIENLQKEKFETMRNYEREKDRMKTDFENERNKLKKNIDDLENEARTLKKEKNDLEEKIRDLEAKHQREKDRMTNDFDDEKRQLKRNLDRSKDDKRDGNSRDNDDKYTRIINELERDKARLLGRLEEQGNMGGQMGPSRVTYESNNTTVGMSNYESENSKLHVQVKQLQQNFDVEKHEITRKFEQEKRTIEARLIHEKKVLEISVQAMTREIAKLKHERIEIRKNYKTEIDKLRVQIERGRVVVHDSNISSSNHESVHSSSSCSSRIVYEEKRTLEKTIDELKETIREHETSLQKLEKNHTEEVRFMVKNFENTKIDLENSWHLEKEKLQSVIEVDYEKKLTVERKKFEKTMNDLRREVNCLQDQRRLLQLKITSNSMFSGDKDNFEKVIREYKRDVVEKLHQEYSERIERERRPLEETIKELRREVNELRQERNEIKMTFRQEKIKLQDEFERERDRLLREKRDFPTTGKGGPGGAKGGVFGFGGIGGILGGRFKPGDEDKVPDKGDPLGHVKKTFQDVSVKRLSIENSSLKVEVAKKEDEIRTLIAKLESLEIRYKHLDVEPSKDKPRYGSGSLTRPSIIDRLVPSGSQPLSGTRTPGSGYPSSTGPAGQRHPSGGSVPSVGHRPSGSYPGASGNYPQRRNPDGTTPGLFPDGGKYPQRGPLSGNFAPGRDSIVPRQPSNFPGSVLDRGPFNPSSAIGRPTFGNVPGIDRGVTGRPTIGTNVLSSIRNISNSFSSNAINNISAQHKRSISVDFLAGRGTGISLGGQPSFLTSQQPGRSNFPDGSGLTHRPGYTPSSYLANRPMPGYSGPGGGRPGYRGGYGGYPEQLGNVGDCGYDGYVDDTGLGVDEYYQPRSNLLGCYHGGQASCHGTSQGQSGLQSCLKVGTQVGLACPHVGNQVGLVSPCGCSSVGLATPSGGQGNPTICVDPPHQHSTQANRPLTMCGIQPPGGQQPQPMVDGKSLAPHSHSSQIQQQSTMPSSLISSSQSPSMAGSSSAVPTSAVPTSTVGASCVGASAQGSPTDEKTSISSYCTSESEYGS